MSDWHARIQRPQQLARALARAGHRCYFLNPHLGREYAAPYPMQPHAQIAELEPGISEIHVHLPREPVYHHRLLQPPETARLAKALGILASAEREVVQIVGFPTWGAPSIELRERFGWRIIYDCHDLLAGFTNVASEIIEAESGVLESSNWVVFSSEYLAAHTPEATAERLTLVRNALDATWVKRVQPRWNADRNTRVIGYFGALQDWFDAEAVEQAAAAHPTFEFRIIGRIEDSLLKERLVRFPNVHLAGELAHSDLPNQLAEFDVGIIPFHVRQLTMATDPIKLYEYFAAGIPIVSSPLPEVARFGELVYIAAAPSEWPSQIETAARENDAGLRAKRRDIALRETWDERASRFVEIAESIRTSR
jgi:glycosyltransferase involved in cell wall biosynthesis